MQEYDYSQAGCYFVTICTKDMRGVLGQIAENAPASNAVGNAPMSNAVGNVPMSNAVGNAPTGSIVGDVPPRVPSCDLSKQGAFINEQINKINQIYPFACVDKYVIMPNHIHMIITIVDANVSGTRGGTPPTSVSGVIQSLKSMTTRRFGINIWQRAFHDHIIRNEADYLRIWKYIDENPLKWREDCYYHKG